jgi:hypothetical protein
MCGMDESGLAANDPIADVGFTPAPPQFLPFARSPSVENSHHIVVQPAEKLGLELLENSKSVFNSPSPDAIFGPVALRAPALPARLVLKLLIGGFEYEEHFRLLALSAVDDRLRSSL